jgi:hypothetical protein
MVWLNAELAPESAERASRDVSTSRDQGDAAAAARGFRHRLLKNSEKEHSGGERPAQAMAHKAKPPKARDVERFDL